MTPPHVLFFDHIADADGPTVGGKGLSLARTARAGLPVPPGFVVTTHAYRERADIRSAVEEAYTHLGGGPVAVRSSATAEDAADTSFAGQMETFLGVEGTDAVLAAIRKCWDSLHSERSAAYRTRQGVGGELAIAVVVQKLVPAEVAGVLFTRDPHDPDGERMLAEASWGLGEAVVSGRVTPDRFTLDFATGNVLTRHLGPKAIRVTPSGEEHVLPADQQRFCLSDTALSQLAELGRRVEAFYGEPRDIEWAYAGGAFHLLQARPITVATAAEREQVRREVVGGLWREVDQRDTVWVRYNLSEVLPRPTPMTWVVVSRLLAANGGFGAMNRDLGASPDPALGAASAFDLIAGRPMMNLARAPRVQFENPPFRYPLEDYKADPRKALDPKPKPDPLAGRGLVRGLLGLPGTMMKLSRVMKTTQAQAETFAARFTNEIVPPFVAAARDALQPGLGGARLAAGVRRVRGVAREDAGRVRPPQPEADRVRRPRVERAVRHAEAEARRGAGEGGRGGTQPRGEAAGRRRPRGRHPRPRVRGDRPRRVPGEVRSPLHERDGTEPAAVERIARRPRPPHHRLVCVAHVVAPPVGADRGRGGTDRRSTRSVPGASRTAPHVPRAT